MRVWGWVCLKADPDLVTSRIEPHIMGHLLVIMKDALQGKCVVIGITCIAQALQKAHSKTNYQLKTRNQLLEGMIILRGESKSF